MTQYKQKLILKNTNSKKSKIKILTFDCHQSFALAAKRAGANCVVSTVRSAPIANARTTKSLSATKHLENSTQWESELIQHFNK